MNGRTSIDPRWRCMHEDGSPFPGETHPASVSLRTGQPVTGVVMGVHHPDGRVVWISINTVPLQKPGASAHARRRLLEVAAGREPLELRLHEPRQVL